MKGARVRATLKRDLATLAASLALLASAPAAAQTWNVTVTSEGTLESSELKKDAINEVTGEAADLAVTCQTASDCDRLKVVLQPLQLELSRIPAHSNNFQVPADPL